MNKEELLLTARSVVTRRMSPDPLLKGILLYDIENVGNVELHLKQKNYLTEIGYTKIL